LTAPPEPKTCVKKREAAICSAFSSSALGTIKNVSIWSCRGKEHILTGCEVRNVGQEVQYGDKEKSDESVLLDRLDWVLESSQYPMHGATLRVLIYLDLVGHIE